MNQVPETVIVKATQIAIKALIEIMMAAQAAPEAERPEKVQEPGTN